MKDDVVASRIFSGLPHVHVCCTEVSLERQKILLQPFVADLFKTILKCPVSPLLGFGVERDNHTDKLGKTV